MTQPASDSPFQGIADPVFATAFRDFLSDHVEDAVKAIRPSAQAGLVLRVYRDGVTFPVGPPWDSAGGGTWTPPEGPGNPAQVYYADVRLDTGDTIKARCGAEIPFCRTATFYDPASPAGETAKYMVASDGIYHKTMLDENGKSVPDPNTAFGPPSVAPRVLIEGTAGAYRIVEIIRGLTEFNNPVLNDPLIINGNATYIYDESNAVEAFLPVSDEYAVNHEGHIGCFATSGLIEVTYSSPLFGISKWQFHVSSTGESWRMVRPSFQNQAFHYVGGPSGPAELVLQIWCKEKTYFPGDPSPRYWVYLHVGHRTSTDILEYPATLDQQESPRIVVRSVGGDLALLKIDNVVDDITVIPPTGALTVKYKQHDLNDQLGDGVMGMTPGPVSSTEALKKTLNGGGIVTFSRTGLLKWTQRFIVMTSKNAYQGAPYYEITMPVNFSIPVYGGPEDPGVASSVFVDSNGVSLQTWEGLYYRLPLDSTDTSSDPNGFVIVRYFGFQVIPDTWILLAFRNADASSADIMLGNGREVDSWKTMTTTPTVGPNGSLPPQYKKESGVVYLRGGFSMNNTVGTGWIMENMFPVGFRPSQSAVLPTTKTSGGVASFARTDANASGQLIFRNSFVTNDQLFLDGISFPAGA